MNVFVFFNKDSVKFDVCVVLAVDSVADYHQFIPFPTTFALTIATEKL